MAHALRALLVAAALPLTLAATCTNTTPANSSACSQTPGAQGWTPCEAFAWYADSQGSRLIPQAWLHALEQPGAQQPFLDPTYIAQFRYLASPTPPDGVPKGKDCPFDPALPLGFVVDCQADTALAATKLQWKAGQGANEPWVGLNCSACHTAEVQYQAPGAAAPVTLRFDGGPTLADFQSFTEALDLALIHTANDPATFGRFAAGVLGTDNTAANQALLRAALAKRIKWDTALARLNGDATLQHGPVPYGFGRLDAVGHIFNKAALIAQPDDAIDQTVNPADAPVSYPFLWNVPQQDRVEWDGLANNVPPSGVINFDYGALGRNTGEVIGVFGDVIITSHPGLLQGYVSSIDEENLIGMEQQIGKLHPPTWPAAFPAIDTGLAAQGAQLFRDRHCNTCHTVPAVPPDLSERYSVTLSHAFKSGPSDPNFVGTDFWMACNVALDQSSAGAFQGTPVDFVSGTPIAGTSFTASLTKNAVTGVLIGKKGDLVRTELQGIFGIDRGLPLPSLAQVPNLTQKQLRAQKCQSYVDDPKNPLMVYKGRPLQGIWATAPYLHNGSVPTLHDLLLPPAQRPAVFYTGTRLYDPVLVGYRTQPGDDGNSFKFDANQDGNSNAGHDYGNGSLTPQQRDALVEYMKTL